MKKTTAKAKAKASTVKPSKRRGGVPAYTKRDLVQQVARDRAISQESVYAVVQGAIETLEKVLVSGRAVEFRDFGVFAPVVRKSRVGRNPKKPEDTVVIPDRRTIKFRPGRKFRDLLEGSAK